MKVAMLIIAILILVACGGSSGTDPLSGVWVGRLDSVEVSPDGCDDRLFLEAEFIIATDNGQVSVESEFSPVLVGEITPDNSFEARFDVGSGLSPTSFSLLFENVIENAATATFSDFQGSFTEERGLVSCLVRFSGTLRRI